MNAPSFQIVNLGGRVKRKRAWRDEISIENRLVSFKSLTKSGIIPMQTRKQIEVMVAEGI